MGPPSPTCRRYITSTPQWLRRLVFGPEPSLLKEYRQALAKREGALLPLITEHKLDQRFVIERHLCVDTTAAGGNASLIAASE